MQDYSLIRTGNRNIEFHGEKLCEAKSPAFRRHEKNPTARAHWFESAVYRTKGGKFVVQIAYRWAGALNREINQDYVFVTDSLDGILKTFEEFVPTDCVTGYPDGEHWVKKQATLMSDIDGDFDLLQEMVQTQIERLKEPERID